MPQAIDAKPQPQNPQPQQEQLAETILDWRSTIQIEHDSRAIRNVALAGTKSQNGYRYSESALKQAAPLYERVPVFLDHPASVQQPRRRSTRDLAGRVRNVRFENDRLRGDLELCDTEAGRTLLALAESDGPGVGMSHVVLAERSRDGATVDRIIEVISVDAVAFPATTTTFHEGQYTNPKRKQGNPPTTNPKRQRGNLNLPEPRPDHDETRGNDPQRDFDLQPRGLATATAASRKPATLPGSLERLVAAIDRRLPAHMARLAVASGLPCPGRASRVAVFPRHLVVEWRFEGQQPRRFALAWTLERDGVHLASRLKPLESLAEQHDSWHGRLGTRRAVKNDPTHTERASLVTSRPRRATNTAFIDDAAFIRTLSQR